MFVNFYVSYDNEMKPQARPVNIFTVHGFATWSEEFERTLMTICGTSQTEWPIFHTDRGVRVGGIAPHQEYKDGVREGVGKGKDIVLG